MKTHLDLATNLSITCSSAWQDLGKVVEAVESLGQIVGIVVLVTAIGRVLQLEALVATV